MKCKTVGDHIRHARLNRKLTLPKTAKLIGVREQTVCMWEMNHNIPVIKHMPSIIKFLGYIPFKIENISFAKKLNIARYCSGNSIITLSKALNIPYVKLNRCEHGYIPDEVTMRKLNAFIEKQFEQTTLMIS